MNYAEQLRDTYFENKDRIAKQRKEQHLSYVLTLEDKLKDGYKAYKEFCYATERHPHHLTGREIQEIHELHFA